MDIDAVSPGIWTELENKLDAFGVKEEYEYLTSLGNSERTCIGMKRGLMGDLTGEYIWFLVPIFNLDPAQPGNAIAMEATAIEGSGKATYFFKITDSSIYEILKNQEELQAVVDKSLKQINRDLITVNFRREPIYLTDEQLNSITYVAYRRAVLKVPALQELRRLFIGRVIHNSPEQWKEAITQLLKSNMNTA
jgi:thiamine kinase-like enzyme